MLPRAPLDPPVQPQRQSCDRCYKQKLRCTREKAVDDKACDRCSRKGVPCVYSSSLPKGRPSLQRQAEESGTNGAARLRKSSESESGETQTAAPVTEVACPASSGTSISTELAIEPLFANPNTADFGQTIMSDFMDMDTGSEARSWLDKYAMSDGQLCVDWSRQTPGVSQYGSSSSSGFPPSPASLSPLFGGTHPVIEAHQEPSKSTTNDPMGIMQAGAPVISQLLQLGMRLSVLYDSCSRLANSTQPFSDPLSGSKRARLVQNIGFDSVAVWLAQGHSSMDTNMQAPPHVQSESWSSLHTHDHASSEQETQVPMQGQSILQEVFSASHDFLEIFRHLNADRTQEQREPTSAAPKAHRLDTHSAGTWGHNGVSIPDVSMQSGSSEGQIHDRKVVRYLGMACDMMLLRIHLAVLIALRYDARLHSQSTGSVLGDARVILVVQLCSLLIERQCQAVDMFNIEESPTPTPLSSTYPEQPLLTDRQPAIDLRTQVQAMLAGLRQSLNCTM